MIRLAMWLVMVGGVAAIAVLGFQLRRDLRRERYETRLADRIRGRMR